MAFKCLIGVIAFPKIMSMYRHRYQDEPKCKQNSVFTNPLHVCTGRYSLNVICVSFHCTFISIFSKYRVVCKSVQCFFVSLLEKSSPSLLNCPRCFFKKKFTQIYLSERQGDEYRDRNRDRWRVSITFQISATARCRPSQSQILELNSFSHV